MVTYTSSATYWSPLKPRIRIYALQDTTYAAPIYSYNPFTDVGETTKPIALTFDSQTTNAGTFSIEIEDKDTQLDPDTFTKGNRVFIDCSKDGTTFQPAFKGLVRATEQNIYATTGRNLVLQGYSYLVRLNERIVNTIKESSVVGDDYVRTDSTMFSNNLINNILSTDSNYVNSVDDTQLYSIFKKGNITSSQIVEWIPRLDAQLVTVNDAINSVLETSNGLMMLNPADDELMLYTSDLITSATGIFLLTNQINENADDGDYTMYPLESYKYNISYDYPDSGSRLIGSIGETGNLCAAEEELVPPSLANDYDPTEIHYFWTATAPNDVGYACSFISAGTNMRGLRIALTNLGNISGETATMAELRTYVNIGTPPGSIVGSPMTLYKVHNTEGTVTPGLAYPSVNTLIWYIGLQSGDVGPTISVGTYYWLYLYPPDLIGDGSTMDNTHKYAVIDSGTGGVYVSTNNGTTWSAATGNPSVGPRFRFDYTSPARGACGGGTQATLDAEPVFAVAHDRNMSNRLGVVERVITGIPTHIKTKQTLNEYLFNKLYFAAKPRFTFDFPSVTMPNKLPKAGDICAHVDTKTNTGLADAPIQTGIISSVSYDFAQGTDGALGLRKIGLSTTGIKRGSY